MTIDVLPLILPPPWPQGWPERIDHKIVKAAVKVGDKVYVGWRHAHIISYLHCNGVVPHVYQEMQGFVDNMGWFFNRQNSVVIASGARQCRWDQIKCKQLLSEDLWDNEGKPHVH